MSLIDFIRCSMVFSRIHSAEGNLPIAICWSKLALHQLCPTRATCGPIEGFVRPSLGFHCTKGVSYIQTTYPYFDSPKFVIFDAGGLQYHFITSVTNADRIRTLSVH